MEAIIEVVLTIVWVLLAITILVFVHEMGHFLTAKMFKMRVDKFSIGFPPKIYGKQIGETEYVIGATPLGGYVKIAGMVDESMDTDMLEANEPQPWEYRAKPVWQRAIVITAGVIFNIILAAIIFAGLNLKYGDRYIPAENVKSVHIAEGSVAESMGLRTGDRIVAVSGRELERYDEVESLESLLADPLLITVEREGEEMTFEGPHDIMTQLSRSGGGLGISLEPSLISSASDSYPASAAGMQQYDQITSINGKEIGFWVELIDEVETIQDTPVEVQWKRPDSLFDASTVPETTTIIEQADGYVTLAATMTPQKEDGDDQYMLGVTSASGPMLEQVFGVERVQLGLGASINQGIKDTWINTVAITTSLKRIFTGRENLRENLGGPVRVAQVTKQAADAGLQFFWRIVAILSITLAIMNILPIPALDGGHLMFLIYEGIVRREPSLKVRMWLQQAGMFLLLLLMVFLVFNDILRL